MSWTRDEMAARAARELSAGNYVNLGIGIPTRVANFLNPKDGIILQSENGLLDIGPYPEVGQADPDLVNAGKETVTALPTSSFFGSHESFAMIRGGHIDVAILGTMEVACNGDIANWAIPGKRVTGVGGAMDLVSGVKRVIVLTDHVTRKGTPKLRARCTLPLTGRGSVQRVITDLGVFDCNAERNLFQIVELAPGITHDEVTQKTDADLSVPKDFA